MRNVQRSEDFHHEEKESNENVSVETILEDELFSISSYDVRYPSEETVRKWIDSFPMCENNETRDQFSISFRTLACFDSFLPSISRFYSCWTPSFFDLLS